MDFGERAEANLSKFLIDMGRAGGGQQHHDDSLTWTIGGSPIDYHNAVVRACLTPETADEAIDEVIANLDRFAVPGSWHATPSMVPADLPQRLLAKGFKRGAGEVAMALDLRNWSVPRHQPAALLIKDVLTGEDLDLWRATLGAGFGAGPQEADWVAEVFASLGVGASSPWHHYLALWDGTAVATMTTLEHDNTAGCYFVFTVEGYRQRGIAGCMLSKALGDAIGRGSDLAILAASAMGKSLYEQLGFRVCGYIDIFEYAGPDG